LAIAVAVHHLADIDALGIASKGRRDRPRLEGRIHCRLRRRMEVVIDPDRIPRTLVRFLRDPGQRLELLDGILDTRQIHAPTLGNENTEVLNHRHTLHGTRHPRPSSRTYNDICVPGYSGAYIAGRMAPLRCYRTHDRGREEGGNGHGFAKLPICTRSRLMAILGEGSDVPASRDFSNPGNQLAPPVTMRATPKHHHVQDDDMYDTWPDEGQVEVDDAADFSYLDHPPVVSDPEPPRHYTRMMSRRSLIGLGVGSIAAMAAIGVPIATEGSFYPGTAVGGVDISQMTFDDAIATLRDHFANFENTAVDFEFEDQRWNAGLAQLGFEIDYETTLQHAYQHGRSGDIFDRYAGVLLSPEVRSYPVIYKRDDAKLKAFLEQIGTEILGAARDARLYLSGGKVEILPNRDGRQLNIEQAIHDTVNIVESAKRGTVSLRAVSVVSQVTAEDLEPMRELAQTMISAPVSIQDGASTWTVGTDMLLDA